MNTRERALNSKVRIGYNNGSLVRVVITFYKTLDYVNVCLMNHSINR